MAKDGDNKKGEDNEGKLQQLEKELGLRNQIFEQKKQDGAASVELNKAAQAAAQAEAAGIARNRRIGGARARVSRWTEEALGL